MRVHTASCVKGELAVPEGSDVTGPLSVPVGFNYSVRKLSLVNTIQLKLRRSLIPGSPSTVQQWDSGPAAIRHQLVS